MIEIGRPGNTDSGTWVDRYTRHDGIDVLCNFRTVDFKKFLNVPSNALWEGTGRRARSRNGIALIAIMQFGGRR
jgi:hypothetical protein